MRKSASRAPTSGTLSQVNVNKTKGRQMIPLISSLSYGPLEVLQLPRTWWKVLLRKAGLLDEEPGRFIDLGSITSRARRGIDFATVGNAQAMLPGRVSLDQVPLGEAMIAEE